MVIETTKKEDQFIAAYLGCILFADRPEDCDSIPDLDTDFERESIIDCLAFYSRIACYLSDDNIEQAGHDFYLTRQGYGTGFWDRTEIYGDLLAEKFTKMAENSGEVYPVFDDIMIWKAL